MNYKIVGKYIKQLNFNIPKPETFFLLSKNIKNYKINIDIKSFQIKQNIIEVLTTLTLNPIKEDFEKIDTKIVYSTIIEGIGESGDVLIGLSTSGNSKNIINAFDSARKKGLITIGLTGSKKSKMDKVSDFMIKSPSTSTPRIQESHILIGHVLCEFVEKIIFKDEI